MEVIRIIAYNNHLLNRGLCPHYSVHQPQLFVEGANVVYELVYFYVLRERGAEKDWFAFFNSYVFAPAESWAVSALQHAPTAAFRAGSQRWPFVVQGAASATA